MTIFILLFLTLILTPPFTTSLLGLTQTPTIIPPEKQRRSSSFLAIISGGLFGATVETVQNDAAELEGMIIPPTLTTNSLTTPLHSTPPILLNQKVRQTRRKKRAPY